jgi:putative ABC transport system permease protein
METLSRVQMKPPRQEKNMFDMETAIKQWRKKLDKNEALEDGYKEELESHLRDAFDRLIQQGKSSETAFEEAEKKLGDVDKIGGDYFRTDTRRRSGRLPWAESRWALSLLSQYWKIGLRKIKRQKLYSFINIAGLALGMACALLILLWVQDELSFDRFHANAKTIYRVEWDQQGGQGKFHLNITPYGMASALKAEIPDIQDTTRVADKFGDLLLRNGEKAFYEDKVLGVDSSFLRMLTYPAVRGNAGTALDDPGSLVITERLAEKYFGAEDPIGKSVTINNAFPVTISAVLKTPPANSSLVFDALLPMEFLKNLGVDINGWKSNEIFTFAQLKKSGAAAAVAGKITRLVHERALADWRGDDANWKKIQADPEQLKQYNSYTGPDYMLMPLIDINLYGYFGSDRNAIGIQYVRTFLAIALFVLLIAGINFMNLATARSAGRAREVGLRKVVGAGRRTIAGQFYGESILTAVLAGLAAVILVALLLPAFNSLSGKHLVPASLLAPSFLLGILAVTLTTGFVAGSYPALFLSSFQPVKVLKGRLAGGARSAAFRKALVVVQFGLSILLLIGMGGVSHQLDYMRSKKLGYDKDRLIYLPLRGESRRTYQFLKERILGDPKIGGVTASNMAPTGFGSTSTGAAWDGKDPNQWYRIGVAFVDFDFPETMKIEMAAGRPFDEKFSSDRGGAFLVNEGVVKLMGLDPAAAVGKSFDFLGIKGPIVGVMKDFHYQSVRASIEPLVLVVPKGSRFNYATVRLKAGAVRDSLDSVRASWQAVNPRYPFDYRFFDQDFDQMYRADERMGSVLKVFAALAVIIACLGLFGLASFTAEQRTKEIGVRKVLGASVPGVVALLSKEFAKWVLLANLPAWPVAYFLMRNWLQGFAYKAGLAWWLFVLAGAGALAVALLTVSFQAVRAARSNPIESLKYE